MERSLLSWRDRTGAAAAVLLIHAALLLALLSMSRDAPEPIQDSPAIETFDVPKRPPPPVVEQVKDEPAPKRAGAASPPNRRSEATPVVVPKPVVAIPRPAEVVASPTPRAGDEPTQGAAPVAGPGTGASGEGSGTGSGGAGSGPGGGGVGATRPRLIAGQFRTRHYPRELQDAWATSPPVLITFKVQLNGRISDCRVYESSGNLAIDRETCRLAEQRLRFRPALDPEGRPYVESYGYQQARTR
jgi:protein TonB